MRSELEEVVCDLSFSVNIALSAIEHNLKIGLNKSMLREAKKELLDSMDELDEYEKKNGRWLFIADVERS